MRCGELSRKRSGQFWIGKTPVNDAAVGIVLALAADRFDAVPSVKFVHAIQPFAETTGRYDHVHDVREIFLDGLGALPAFVAGHVRDIFCSTRSRVEIPCRNVTSGRERADNRRAIYYATELGRHL
jgi:hypothetical protein